MSFYTIGVYKLPIINIEAGVTKCTLPKAIGYNQISDETRGRDDIVCNISFGAEVVVEITDLKAQGEAYRKEKEGLSYVDTLSYQPLSHFTHITKIEFLAKVLTEGLRPRAETDFFGNLSISPEDSDGRFVYTQGVSKWPLISPLQKGKTVHVNVVNPSELAHLDKDWVRLSLSVDLLSRGKFFVAPSWSFGPFQRGGHEFLFYYDPKLRETEDFATKVPLKKVSTSINEAFSRRFWQPEKEVGFMGTVPVKEHLISIDVPTEEIRGRVLKLLADF